jgi:hypothetical protein
LRLIVIGPAGGHLATAAGIAADNSAAVNHADGIETALAVLRSTAADLLMADLAVDIRRLAARLDAAGVQAPAAARGTEGDIAAVPAVADDRRESPPGSPPNAGVPTAPLGAHAPLAADAVTHTLVGRTVADVERDLILETLKRCLGNRTHAAAILGISIRTLRNKLTVYAAAGSAVPPPNNGEIRGAA